jgi:hypothetical protein
MPPDEPATAQNGAERAPALAGLHDRINRDFTQHGARGDQPERAEKVRGWAREFAHVIVDQTVPGREQDNALAKLEEVVFWTAAAISRENR